MYAGISHRVTDSRFRRISSVGAVTLALVMACASICAATGSIFDDDWTPPKPVGKPHAEPAKPPAVAPVPPAIATQPAAAPSPIVPAPPAPAAQPAEAAPPAVSRRAIPAKPDQTKSRALLREVFAKQISDRSFAGRKKLAQTLLDEAPKNANVPADQFVILVGAIEASKDAADFPLCFQAVDVIAGQYEIDGLSVKVDAVLKASLRGNSPAKTTENIKAALGLIDPLLAAEDFEVAAKIVALVRPVAGTDRALRLAIQDRAQVVDAARATHERLAPLMEKLKTAPDDPAANLAIGSFLCFSKGDWQRGLPMLAKGSDANLKQLAMLDLSAPSKPDDVIRLADGWWDVSAKEAAASRTVVHRHAASLYKMVLEGTTGLRRALLVHRIADAGAEPTVPLPSHQAPKDPPAAVNPSPPANPAAPVNPRAEPAATGRVVDLHDKRAIVHIGANKDWQQAIHVKSGNVLTIAATGIWCHNVNDRKKCTVDADGVSLAGVPPGKDGHFINDAPFGALIGQIGAQKFVVGKAARVKALNDGILELRMNDIGAYDNDGEVRVEIKLEGP